MIRRPPRSTRTDTPFPYTTLFRAMDPAPGWGQAVVEEIAAAVGEAAAETTPVGSVGAGSRIVQTATDRFGRVDILINNAGISRPAPFGEDSDADIERVFSVNLFGTYALMRAVWPRSDERRVGNECVSPCRSRRSPYH